MWQLDARTLWARDASVASEQTAEFVFRVTVDETWIHYYTPETKSQSKMWTGPGESAPKKAKTIPSAGKIMATIFWDSRGIILIDYLQKGKTITGEYYASLLDRFDAILKEKRPIWRKKCFSITTMHQLTRVPLQRPNYLIYATKYFLIHLIPQIWLLLIIFCFLT